MDNISIEVIFVLIVMIVSAIKWVAENVLAKKGGPPPLDGEGGGSTLEDLYEEARREIQERQSRRYPEADQAEEAETYWDGRQVEPPPVAKVVPPPLPSALVSPPPFDQHRQIQRPKLTAAEKSALERMQKREQKGRRKGRRPAAGHTDLRSLLQSPSAARNAIVLREILGPPKGAREIQDHLA
jgi:hypothetical protein